MIIAMLFIWCVLNTLWLLVLTLGLRWSFTLNLQLATIFRDYLKGLKEIEDLAAKLVSE